MPLGSTLKLCTLEEKNTYCQKYKNSKVFKRNMQRLNEALVEFPQKSVSFLGGNLYIVPSKEHNENQARERKFVKKYSIRGKSLKKQQSEKKESWSLEPLDKLN